MKFVSFFWVRNVTPISLMRKAGPMSGKLLELFSLKKFCSIPREETSYLESYLEQINLMSGSGELALIYILHPGGYAKNPLCKRLHSLKIPMAFFYGDRDWMNKKGAEQLAESNDNIHLKIISNSDHHLYWDNPRELSEKMMSILKEFDNLTL